MRGMLYFFSILLIVNAVNNEYHRPSCGTANICGAPIHDFLHKVW